MAIWFTADTHFGHEAMVTLANRPFRSVLEMDAALITRWNTAVAPGDTVWHLGDFSHRASLAAHVYRGRLNGRIHLIAGNHDGRIVERAAHLFESIGTLREIEVGGQAIVLCHYPMIEWPGAWRGAWHLFGHVHGRLDGQPNGLSLDVGVDSHQMQPVGLERVKQILAGRTNPFRSSRRRLHRPGE